MSGHNPASHAVRYPVTLRHCQALSQTTQQLGLETPPPSVGDPASIASLLSVLPLRHTFFIKRFSLLKEFRVQSHSPSLM